MSTSDENVSPAPVAAVVMHPVPSEEEAAAITAALTLLWTGGAEEDSPPTDPRWRFSGRWWSRPVPLARQRPYRG